MHFAFIGQAEYVTANLTGASRLLLGCAVALPAAICAAAGRGARRSGSSRCPSRTGSSSRPRARRALVDARRALRARSTLLDSAVLIGLYVLYLRRAAAAGGEAPEPMGVAAELAALRPRERHRWVAVADGGTRRS